MCVYRATKQRVYFLEKMKEKDIESLGETNYEEAKIRESNSG